MEDYYKNSETIFKALMICTPPLSKFVASKLVLHFGKDNWWDQGVLKDLKYHSKRNLPSGGTYEELIVKLDIHLLTVLIAEVHWDKIFCKDTPSRFRTYIREIRDIRTEFVAHLGSETIDDIEVSRALDTMIRVLEIIQASTKSLEQLNLLTVTPQTKKQIMRRIEDREPIKKTENCTETLIHKKNTTTLEKNVKHTTTKKTSNQLHMNTLESQPASHKLEKNEDKKAKVKNNMKTLLKKDTIPLLEVKLGQKDSEKMYKLGESYFHGEDIKKNYTKALVYYRDAAELGNTAAMVRIGEIYYNGLGVKQDENQAWTWYLKAAKDKNPDAIIALLDEGWGEEYWDIDYTDILKWAEELGKAGNIEVINSIYDFVDNHVPYGEKIDMLGLCKLAIDAGQTDYIAVMSSIFDQGDYGIKHDKQEALKWFIKWVEATDDAAEMYSLGMSYELGTKAEKDYGEALKWYLKSAEKEHVPAMHALIRMYTKGLGVKREHKEVSKWNQKATQLTYK